jgi:hypothetical protein
MDEQVGEELNGGKSHGVKKLRKELKKPIK